MPRLAPVLLLALAFGTAASAPRAQVADSFATLPYLAEVDPDAALNRIAELTSDPGPDPRPIYDLYRMAAGLLIEGGQVDQAAQAIARLADLAVSSRDYLGFDPLPVYAEAAALLNDTGQDRAARDSLLAMYAEQRSSGAAPQDLTRTADEIARLSEVLGVAAPALAAPLAAENFQTISVYYATDRGISGEIDAPLYYGDGRGAPDWGVATVSRPVRQMPQDYSKLRAVQPMAQADWTARLDAASGQGTLVYVPGAATRFEQAARRAALMAQALGGVEPPVLFSWPASGSTLDYMGDSAAAGASARTLARMLAALAARPGARPPHLLAGGMGAQVLTDALELIAARGEAAGPDGAPPFGQLILAVPDVDADRFRGLLPVLRPLVQRITLYASQTDAQMAVPRRLYGPALRAGWGGEATLVDPAADSIDLSMLEGDMLTAPAVLADMAMLLWRDAAPERRCGLRPEPGGAGDPPVWRPAEAICSDPALLGVLARLRQEDARTHDRALELLRAMVPDPGRRAGLARVFLRPMAP